MTLLFSRNNNSGLAPLHNKAEQTKPYSLLFFSFDLLQPQLSLLETLDVPHYLI